MLGQGELSFPTSLPCCLAPVPALATPSPRHFLAPQGLAWRRQITGNTFLHSKLVCPASYPSSSLPTLLNPSRAPLFCPQSSHVLRLSLRFVISVRCVEQLLEINFTFDSCCRRSPAAPSTLLLPLPFPLLFPCTFACCCSACTYVQKALIVSGTRIRFRTLSPNAHANRRQRGL